MPSLLLGVALIFVFGEVSFADNAANDECLKQQDKCQNCSAEFYTKILLSVNGGVRDKVVKAQNVIMQNGADKVVKLFSQYTLTTTLNYFCCLSDEDKNIVAEMLRRSPHAIPQTIYFQGVQCMKGSDGNIIMFVLNESSETLLKNWVSTVNTYLEDAVEVVDRKDPFNLQLAIVSDEYPMDDVLKMLNTTQFSFDITSFYVSGTIIYLS